MAKKMKFEDALKRLEEIIARLEEGEETLEESLNLFEEGMKLTKFCSRRLEEARKTVEILKRGEDGKVKPQPFKSQQGKGTDKEQVEDGNDEPLLL